ncbi:MAG: hypothetical protein LBH41_01175 [Rickettsiales bacterium]|jgi:hypothetical protein|nr:hypothetical protein [Rickettsiales bacterium]
MGTTPGLLDIFDYAEGKVKSERKSSDAAAKSRQDGAYADLAAELDEAEISARRALFAEQKSNLLREKLASTKAKMAAAGIDGTSASMSAFEKALAKKAEQDILANDYFAGIDIAKLDLASSYKKGENLIAAASNKRTITSKGR